MRLDSTEIVEIKTYVFDNPPTVNNVFGRRWPTAKLTKVVFTKTLYDDGSVNEEVREYGRPIMGNGELRREDWIYVDADELDKVIDAQVG